MSATTVASFVFDRAKVKFALDKWEPVLLSPQGMVGYASPSLGLSGPKDLPKLKGQQLVFFDEWPRPEDRLKGTAAVLRRLAGIAEQAKAA